MIIRLRNLQKYYDKELVLDIKSFDFNNGLYCLLGKNGSGKTTLLKILAGLDRQYHGQVLVEDAGIMLNKKEITMVFQNPYVFDKTVKQNIEYGLKLRGLPEKEIKTRSQYYMDITGLADLSNKNARKLSAGQQQRLCIARAIAIEPKVLLLDEPVSNLDDENKVMVCSILKMIEKKKSSVVVMVTHEIALAREITDKIAYINEKQIQFEGK
ncbi:MAG: ATP-binding cassette domain-containing protein [Eubacteriales bacterium]